VTTSHYSCESYATLHVRPAVSIRGLKAAEVNECVYGLDEVAVDGYGSRTGAGPKFCSFVFAYETCKPSGAAVEQKLDRISVES